ncbi:pantoate--beta-alanine ligase [Streptomyces lycii]|uniref:Pantothenate synthetase n=1 Tax=Streptomyces lycii TaxID=2654337 RepID=A0ABQ7F9Q0_9ACTN|nr:pantoate--beta-alanine ligase [Streptomyces lycii]KAF4405182.1 pantoate--beta-alanine ligase [Streptomyces lycii]
MTGTPAPRTAAPRTARGALRLVRTAAELNALPRYGERAVVMTMGALHEGHAALIRAARAHAGPDGQVLVTVFVNPLQFGAGEDLDRYPRTLDADLAVAGAAGADTVFAPSADEVYPGGEPQVRIAAGPMGERLEGASRPGHFDGMLTVVAKLLHLTAPGTAFYGEKDAQQLALITRMARDLNFPVRIVGVPTVREGDGLALSSRNGYLSEAERRAAPALFHALRAGREAGLRAAGFRDGLGPAGLGPAGRLGPAGAAAVPGADPATSGAGPDAPATPAGPDARADSATPADPDVPADSATPADPDVPADTAAPAAPEARAALVADPDAVRAAARRVLDEAARAEPPVRLDYLALVDPSDFTEVTAGHTGEAVLAVAARLGATRLIDNIRLSFGAAV